jgi:hypothetical protein
VPRKYTPPKKKKKSAPQAARVHQAPPAQAHTTEFSIAHPPAFRATPAAETQVDAVKYASLPYELRRIVLFSAAAIIILLILWLIFR